MQKENQCVEGSAFQISKGALSVPDFCKLFSIGRSLAYEEHRKGRLIFRKVGKRSIILQSEAERWAASLPEAHK